MQSKFALSLGLDPQSSHVLRRFVIVLAFMLAWAIAASPQHPLEALVLMSAAVAAVMDGVIALLRRDGVNAAVLNYWDSTCGFFAVNCLMRGLT
ncbi:MAG: hypothetical protein ACLQME_04030 [Alphaproteobacteria bacterium]